MEKQGFQMNNHMKLSTKKYGHLFFINSKKNRHEIEFFFYPECSDVIFGLKNRTE